MNSTDLSDATARALDLLPSGDSANADPRFVRDSQLTDEARLTKEVAAAVWLAVSPLHVAPPNVLDEVMMEIRQPVPTEPIIRYHVLPWLAVSGWAAAAVMTLFLWPERFPQTTLREVHARPAAAPAERPSTSAPTAASPSPRDARLRKDIGRLQERLAVLKRDPIRRSPRVMSLSAPGAVLRTEDESRRYVQKLLTDALRSALEAASGAPSDPASLVIERGWLPGGLPFPNDGGWIRHRNFPEQDWLELGLSRAANGNYYDAASQTVWSRDPAGRGFIGRKSNDKDNLAEFTQEPDHAATPLKPQAAPEGFVIENPTDNTTEMFVENMPEVTDGKQLVLQITDAAGVKTETPLIPMAAEKLANNLLTPTDTSGLPVWFNATGTLDSGVLIGGDFTQFSSSKVIGSGIRSTTLSPAAVNFSDVSQYSNIVGYLNGGSLMVSFPNGEIPAEVQLALRDSAAIGEQDEIIVHSEP
jgi:hypothetical protein